jgi:NADPH:quinone reductase-like Zn-dependent oxidoreductase
MLSLALLRTGTPAELAVIDDLPKPSFGDDEVLVRVAASALNRVDQVLMRGYPGLAYRFPHVLGADIAGEVAEVGRNVRGWAPGDSVAVYPLVSCGLCSLCSEGQPHLCERFQFFGMHRPGGFAEFVSVPARNLVRLPSGADAAQAAALGVSGVTAAHALSTNPDLRPGRSILVWGATGGHAAHPAREEARTHGAGDDVSRTSTRLLGRSAPTMCSTPPTPGLSSA